MKPEPTQISADVKSWREQGKHLPPEFRDFHDQKDLFKTMYSMVDIESNEQTKNISWITAHIFIIDMFLWFMARHGYTLQKSRQKLNFNSLSDSIEHFHEQEAKAFSDYLETQKSISE